MSKISQLTPASSLTGVESLPIVQSGNSRKVPVSNILTDNLFTPSGAGAVARSVQDDLRDRISALHYMSDAQRTDVRAGTFLLDVSAALQAAINYASGIGALLFFPPGGYSFAATLIFKNNVIYLGSGRNNLGTKGTILKYTGSSDAIQVNNPINSSTPANYAIEDLFVICTTRTAGKASIADVGSSFVTIRRVGCSGNDYGIILDQTELALLDQCDLELPASGTAGVWLVNGAEHSVGASQNYTNVIAIKHCQFNGTGGVGIGDDGGAAHHFSSNNYNGMATQIRVNGAQSITIDGGSDFESYTSAAVQFATTKLGGGAGSASGSAIIRGCKTNGFAVVNPPFVFGAASLSTIDFSNNLINTTAAVAPVSGAANVSIWDGTNNIQSGAGLADDSSLGNNRNVRKTYFPSWTSSGTAPALGNGTLQGSYVRNGRQIRVNIHFLAGSTTTFGTGTWSFTIPFALTNSVSANGAVQMTVAGAYYVGVAQAVTNGTTITIYPTGAGAQVGPTVPAAWANGNSLDLDITYEMVTAP